MLRGRLLAVVAVTMFAIATGSATAATLTPNTSADDTTAGDGMCSLRKAIEAVDSPGSASGDCAAAAFGANTIVLGRGTYTLGGPFTSSSGQLSVVSTVTSLAITGAGEGKTTIDASALGNRVLDIAAGANVTISDLTITGGRAPDGPAGAAGQGNNGGVGVAGGNGGAILNQGTLTLLDVAVTDSDAGDGGDGGSTSGMPETDPAAHGGSGGAGGEGGAIFSTGGLTLNGVTIADDQAGGGGSGGASAQDEPADSNPGGVGGAGGDGGNGGGVASAGGEVTITGSTIRGNLAGAGGAAGTGGPGPAAAPGFGGAGGKGGAGGGGGGVWSAGGGLSITNDTIASNTTGDGGVGGNGGVGTGSGSTGGAGGNGANSGSGGGIASSDSTDATVLNATLVGNGVGQAGTAGAGGNATFPGAAGGDGQSGVGGGIEADATSTVAVQNSLLALNSGGNCGPSSVSDGGHNLSFGDSTCPASFVNADPRLGALQDNGGPSETVSLQPGSAAIDQIPPTGAGCPATDQRGVKRPSGPKCDIGAYEVAPPVALTGAATSINSTGATVSATVTPNSGDASVRFEYGKRSTYGSTTAAETLDGVTSATVSAKLNGLKPNTLYHYRVIATSPDGQSLGADRTFTATRAPTITLATITPTTFRVTGKHAGATVTYTDTLRATTTFVVLRAGPGVIRGKSCVARPRHGRGRACTQYAEVGTFTHADVVGVNRLSFIGRIRRHALSPGRYKLSLTPRANRLIGNTLSILFAIRH